MQALVIKKFGDEPILELTELDSLIPKAHEVKVAVKAIGVNQADLLQAKGKYPAPPGYPENIPGLEFAGVISQLGSQVNQFEIDDHVFGIIGGGSYAQELTIDARLLTKFPKHLSFIEAAAIPEVFITAYDALITQMKMTKGESVLISVIGSGVGLAGLQIAKAFGATVIGTSRSEDKLAKAKTLGLDHGILVKEQKFSQAVKQILPNGINVIMDLAGGDYLIDDIDCIASQGRIIMVGLLAGAKTNIDLRTFVTKRLLLKGTVLRARPLEEKILVNKMLENDLVPLFEQKKLKANVDKTFSLSDAMQAFDYLASNKSFGKVVLTTE